MSRSTAGLAATAAPAATAATAATAAPPATATTPRFAEKRELILDGAARLFNKRGIKAGTLAEVAASVGLATNSLTYYHRRKEDLVAACLMRSIAAVNQVVAQADRQASLTDRVSGFVEGFIGVLAGIARGDAPELIHFADMRALPEPQAAPVFAAYTDMFRGVRSLLRDGPVSARIALNARAHLLLNLVVWSRAWLGRYEPDDYAQAARRMSDLLLHGLAAPGQRWPVAADLPAELPAALPALAALSPPGPLAAAGTAAQPSDLLRDAYLRAATRLVNLRGVGGASVEDIAATLALTKGSFYHHHDTKEALIADCFERTFGLIRGVQSAALHSGGSGWQRLLRATVPLVRLQLSPQGPLLRITAWNALPEAMRWRTFTTMNRLAERFAALVVDGLVDGSVRATDPAIAAQQVSGLVNALAEAEAWVPGIDGDNVSTLLARPLLLGLLAPDDPDDAPAPPPLSDLTVQQETTA